MFSWLLLSLVFLVVESRKCLYFDGSDDRIVLSNVTTINALDNSDITFAVWFNHDTDKHNTYPIILSNRHCSCYEGFLLGIFATDWREFKGNRPYLQYQYNNMAYHLNYDIIDGKWHHFVVSINKANKIIKYFVDGSLVYTMSNAEWIKNYKLTTNHALWIGWDEGNPSMTAFKGFIKDISIWNKALTDSEALDILQNGIDVNHNNLVHYWKMDENYGSVIYDLKGNNNGYLGTDNHSPQWIKCCRHGYHGYHNHDHNNHHRNHWNHSPKGKKGNDYYRNRYNENYYRYYNNNPNKMTSTSASISTTTTTTTTAQTTTQSLKSTERIGVDYTDIDMNKVTQSTTDSLVIQKSTEFEETPNVLIIEDPMEKPRIPIRCLIWSVIIIAGLLLCCFFIGYNVGLKKGQKIVPKHELIENQITEGLDVDQEVPEQNDETNDALIEGI